MGKFEEEARVMEQREVAHQTIRARLAAPRLAAAARPGQFLMLQVREGLDPLLKRPFSFHRILPEEGVIELLYRVVGRGTWWLSRCEPGTRLGLIGPLGNGFSIPENDPAPVAVLAGGIGIAPLFELISSLSTKGREIHLFYGARAASELLPKEAFDGMGVTVHWSTDDGSLGFRGYVTDLLRVTFQNFGTLPSVLYACGPLAMQFHAARWARESGVPAQLSLESLMGCGIGACLGCALPAVHPENPDADHYVHVCKDGPIFDAGAIRWQRIQTQQIHTPTFLCS